MKNRIFLIILSLFLLIGCFEDKGNYDYLKINEPTFTFKGKPEIYAYLGDTVKFKAQFTLPKGCSEDNFRYEWIIDEIIVHEGRDFNIPTLDILNKLELKKVPEKLKLGIYKIIDKKTGVGYVINMRYIFKSQFTPSSWVILSKNNSNSKLSFVNIKRTQNDQGEDIFLHKMYDNIFEKYNNGKVIPGMPIKIIDQVAGNISTSVGATTIITDQVAWDVNNENFKLVSDLKDEFEGNVPAELKIKDAYYSYKDRNSFIVDEEGKLYFRRKTKNWFGGKYISDPYTIDGKDYKIEFFAKKHQVCRTGLMYDSKNNRILGLGTSYKINAISKADGTHNLDITNLDSDIVPLALLQTTESPLGKASRGTEIGVFIYKKEGKNYLSEFRYVRDDILMLTKEKAKTFEFKGDLVEDSKIWIASIPKYFIGSFLYKVFYTNGSELRTYDYESEKDELFMSFEHKITAVRFNTYLGPGYRPAYKKIAIGLENGDFLLYDLPKGEVPVKVENGCFNVGGEIVDISLVGSKDKY